MRNSFPSRGCWSMEVIEINMVEDTIILVVLKKIHLNSKTTKLCSKMNWSKQ